MTAYHNNTNYSNSINKTNNNLTSRREDNAAGERRTGGHDHRIVLAAETVQGHVLHRRGESKVNTPKAIWRAAQKHHRKRRDYEPCIARAQPFGRPLQYLP